MHAALSEDLAQHKKARWLTPAIFAILRGTTTPQVYRILSTSSCPDGEIHPLKHVALSTLSNSGHELG
jgi:hypothetical protein